MTAQEEGHRPTLRFARDHLQEMTNNDAQIPEADAWVLWYIYKTLLGKMVSKLSAEATAETTAPTEADRRAAILQKELEAEEENEQDDESSEDADLSTYAPLPGFFPCRTTAEGEAVGLPPEQL